MANWVRTRRTVTQERWELTAPTNGAELNKAVSAAATEFKLVHGRPIQWDDDLIITVEDDKLVISFEVTNP